MDLDLLQQVTEEKIIAIVRGIPDEQADAAAEALCEGGIRLIEVTMNTPGALQLIGRWRKRFEGRMLVGAGTVLDVESAEAAVDAGAQYLVTPNVDEAVIRYGASRCAGVFPGAMTPTEIVQAWKYGATAVKLFPTATLGAKYIQELQGPLSHIPLIATGGVDLSNMEQYAKAGAKGFGIGSNLLNKMWIREGDFERIKRNAAEYVSEAKRLKQIMASL